MLTLTIEVDGNEVEFQATEDWKEITLRKFIELCNIEIPEKLRNLWVASSSDNPDDYTDADNKIEHRELEKTFPEYYGKVIKLLTDIPQDVIDLLHGPLREEFFNLHLRHYIYSSFAKYPVHIVDGKLAMYDPKEKESFKFKDEVYYFPKSMKLYGDTIPLAKETAITFAEASDIEVALRDMAEGAANRIPMFVAIYCRPLDEAYDEDEVLKRAELFLDLPMDEIWRVFFCTYRLLRKLQIYTQEFSKNLEPELARKLGSLA